MRYILGISAFYHDSAAALLRDGKIAAAAQEERFTRRKNDERFPNHAIQFCLRQGRILARELDAIVFYDKPITKFTRVLETFLAIAPAGIGTFPQVLPGWLSEKLNLRKTIQEAMQPLSEKCQILFTQHHQAHAASAFFPSPFPRAAILTVDGVGEWATTTLARGHGNEIELLKEIRFPHSVGLLYSAFTAYCGFRVNSGEYKLMGLAPYGQPRFRQAILDHLIDLKEDGSFWLNMEYFDFLRGKQMTGEKFHRLFDGLPRVPESPLEQRHMDVAASIQGVTNEIMLRLARHARQETGEKNLCMAGGVALNCVANSKIIAEKIFDRLWIQPAAGDAGGALGAALTVWHHHLKTTASSPAGKVEGSDAMEGSLLGPEFSNEEIEVVLKKNNAVFQKLNEPELIATTVDLLQKEKVVGWVQGRMEFGPRALGNRSILADPRSPAMQSVLNLKVKFRESFRPFAPAILRERSQEIFSTVEDSPYMLLLADLRPEFRIPLAGPEEAGLNQLKQIRSRFPAVTHVDHTARLQTVDRDTNERFYLLLNAFEKATGCPMLVNTSFNIRGEPIVCTPADAYRCFLKTEMDFLVIGDFLLDRKTQPRGERQTIERILD